MTWQDESVVRGIFENGEVGENVEIKFTDGGMFSGFHDKARSIWIGGYVDTEKMLFIGEFDFDKTGKPCVQLIPDFFGYER